MTATWLLWGTALVMLLIALGGLLWPLLREPTGQEPSTLGAQALMRNLYRAQRDELEREFERHTLGAADRQQALDELQQRMLEDIEPPPGPSSRPWTAGRPWLKRLPAAALSLLMPLGAATLYLHVGDPRAAASQAIGGPGTHASEGGDVDAMVQRLANRLVQHPDDLQGWVVLARSREVQEDFGAASQAYRRAAELAARQETPPALQASLQADLADALASSRHGALDGPVQAALDAALALDPDQPKALALAGTAALRAGDVEVTRRHWQRLLARLEPGSELALRIQRDLAGLEEGRSAPAGPQRGVAGTVALAPSVREQVRPDDTVFIVVRAPAAGPMPVAILRLRAGQLPAAFEMDDRHAMSPDRPMSRFSDLTIQARISRSGLAQRQPGEPASASVPLRAASRGIELLIDGADPTAAR